MVRASILLGVIFVAIWPARAAAQSEPDFFRNTQTGIGSRALGLAGAFVALTDDESALGLNPAGLVNVPRSLEAQLTGWPRAGVRPFRFGGAFHPTRTLATGFAYSRLPVLSLAPTRPGPSVALDSELDEYALGLAYQPNRRISAGLTLLWQRLRVPGPSSASDGAPTFVAGFLYRPPQGHSPRLGVRYRHRASWRFERGAAPGRSRSPSVISAGAAWRYDSHFFFRRFTLTLQPDYVLYSELTPGASGTARARNEIDLRAGLEISWPFGCWTGCGRMVQFRIGVLSAGPPPFRSPRPGPGEDVGQGPGRETFLAGGVSVALRRFHGRVKAELTYDERTRTFAVGIGYRFPTAFRADIEDATRR